MILDKVLILKGLVGVTTIGSAVTVGVVGHMNGWWGNHQLTPEEIKTGLGLPADCNIPVNIGDSANPTCTLDETKLKALKFDGKTDTTSSITVTGGTVTLKISKTSDTTTYPQGYKFTFENTNDLSIPKTSTSDSISIKKGTKTEFKIKGTSASNLSLEKAWTAKSLGEKVGLICPEPTNSTAEKKCSFDDGKINVNNGDTNGKIINGKFQTSGDASNKKMTFAEDQADYNQGFKFYLEEDNDIALTVNGSDGSSGEKKIIKKGSNGSETTYEIKEDSSDNKWYLTKKTNGSNA